MPRKSEETTRQCLLTRQSLPKGEMIRFVLAPDGSVAPDLKMRLPGRGIWVTARYDMIGAAAQKGLFARGFKQAVNDCSGLADLVDRQLEQSCLASLSMTRKAGQILTGFAKVESAIAQSRPAALVHAADAAEDGQKKLAQSLRRHYGSNNGCPVIRLFSAEALSLALGQGNVVHAALLAGSAGQSFLQQAQKLEAFRAGVNEASDKG